MLTPVQDRKVRFALVGTGRISANHFGAMEQHNDRCEVVDVCDIDPVALAQAVEKTGAQGHTSLQGLLGKTTADAVILTTPSGLHPRQAIEVAQSGRHVVSEKPMATQWHEALATHQP